MRGFWLFGLGFFVAWSLTNERRIERRAMRCQADRAAFARFCAEGRGEAHLRAAA